jgi:hypothetical protein
VVIFSSVIFCVGHYHVVERGGFWNGYLFRKIIAVVIDFGGCMLEILIPLVCALCEIVSEIQTTADAQDDRHNISAQNN